jgi:serine/threonine-protein phosphatase 6 regulatory ankyrin repeat subunit B
MQKSNDNNWTPLIWASYFGHRDIVKLLISKDADVNAKSFDNNTALTYASLLGFKEIVKDLIDAGTDVNVSNIHVGLR